MKKLVLLSLLVFFAVSEQLSAQCSQCTPVNCAIQKPAGGLCNQAPDDTAGQPYDAVISFYAPKELTDPVTLAQCSGCSKVELRHLTIVGIQGLPTGVSASANHPNNYYDVWGGDSTGCVQFCGTPVAPGTYYIVVNLLADVVAVGTPIGNVTVNGQAQTYRDTIVIFPSVSECPQSFSIGSGACVLKSCDALALDLNATLTNTNCPSLISYNWIYGNGGTSAIKTPGVVNYNVPDTFPLTLTTTYYTYRVKNVTAGVTGGFTGDVEELTGLSNPDPYIIIPSLGFNNRGGGSDQDAVTFNNLNLVIPENNCATPLAIQVWDEDTGPPQGSNPLGSQDDNCGTHNVTPSVPNQVQSVVSNSTVSVTFDTVATSSLVETVNVIVFPPAPIPVLTASVDSICDGDSTTLTLATPVEGFGYNWYLNDTTEFSSIDSFLVVKTSGEYKVKITNTVTGCSEFSAPYPIAVGSAAPASISIIFTGTQEFVSPFPSSGFAVDWYYNGNLVVGQNGKFLPYLGDGVYTAELYNANFPYCRVAADPYNVTGVNDMADNSVYDISVYPNPNNGKFKVNFATDETQDIRLVVSNTIGQTVADRKMNNFNGTFNEELDLSDLSKGVYVVAIETTKGKHNSKVVVQ